MAERVCPFWVGYLLINPFRRLFQNPARILGRWLAPGMTVLEVGPGMGFFSLDVARLIGPGGRLVCVDVQPGMIETLRKRAAKAGLADRIDARTCSEQSLGIEDLAAAVDFAFVIFTAHEVPEPREFFAEIARSLKRDGKLFLAEPSYHVGEDRFREIEASALDARLRVVGRPRMSLARTALMAPAD